MINFFATYANATLIVKKISYESHQKGEKHTKLLDKITPKPCQPLIANFSKDHELSWHYKVTNAFLRSNLPFHKMNKVPLKNLFLEIGHQLPSETKSITVATIAGTFLQ